MRELGAVSEPSTCKTAVMLIRGKLDTKKEKWKMEALSGEKDEKSEREEKGEGGGDKR